MTYLALHIISYYTQRTWPACWLRLLSVMMTDSKDTDKNTSLLCNNTTPP